MGYWVNMEKKVFEQRVYTEWIAIQDQIKRTRDKNEVGCACMWWIIITCYNKKYYTFRLIFAVRLGCGHSGEIRGAWNLRGACRYRRWGQVAPMRLHSDPLKTPLVDWKFTIIVNCGQPYVRMPRFLIQQVISQNQKAIEPEVKLVQKVRSTWLRSLRTISGV